MLESIGGGRGECGDRECPRGWSSTKIPHSQRSRIKQPRVVVPILRRHSNRKYNSRQVRHGMPIQSAGIASPDSRCSFSGWCRLALGGPALEEPTILQTKRAASREAKKLFLCSSGLTRSSHGVFVRGREWNMWSGVGEYGGVEVQNVNGFVQINLCRCIYHRTPWEPAELFNPGARSSQVTKINTHVTRQG